MGLINEWPSVMLLYVRGEFIGYQSMGYIKMLLEMCLLDNGEN